MPTYENDDSAVLDHRSLRWYGGPKSVVSAAVGLAFSVRNAIKYFYTSFDSDFVLFVSTRFLVVISVVNLAWGFG